MPKLSQKLSTRLHETVREYTSASIEMKRLEAVKDAAAAKLLAEADEAGGTVETDLFRVKPVPGTSAERISKELLIKFGVSPKIIAKATIPGTKFRYPRITDKTAPKKGRVQE